ncbi:hypothetical protein M5D96_001314, partial [Drosophila gunungcola]
ITDLIESGQVSDGETAASNAEETTISSPRRYANGDTIVMQVNAVTHNKLSVSAICDFSFMDF